MMDNNREEIALGIVMDAVRSPYTKVNDDEDLHPHEGDGYLPDQQPDGVVWISARPNQLLIGRNRYSYEPWVNAVIEAQDRVYSLVQRGHQAARAVVDLHHEIALTCDTCGLWAHVGHKSNYDRNSDEHEIGALLVESCDPTAVHRLFGKPFDPDSAFDRGEQTDYGDKEREAKGTNRLWTKKRRVSNAAATKKR